MQEKNFEKITVSEITQTAGVGRSTWFRNFSDKNEPLSYKLVQLWNRWAEEHHLMSHQRFTLDNASDFFHFNYSIRKILKTINDAGLQDCIYEAFCTIMMPQYKAPYKASPFECYHSRFYSYGLFGLLEEWIKRDFAEDPAQMLELFHQVMADSN